VAPLLPPSEGEDSTGAGEDGVFFVVRANIVAGALVGTAMFCGGAGRYDGALEPSAVIGRCVCGSMPRESSLRLMCVFQ
jgi:hypothetical protein